MFDYFTLIMSHDLPSSQWNIISGSQIPRTRLAVGHLLFMRRSGGNGGSHPELVQVGGGLPVFVVTDSRHAWEADGDAVGGVHFRLGELGAGDLPDRRSLQQTNPKRPVSSAAPLFQQLQDPDSRTTHLRVADDEVWIIVLHDFQPAGDFAGLLRKQKQLLIGLSFPARPL